MYEITVFFFDKGPKVVGKFKSIDDGLKQIEKNYPQDESIRGVDIREVNV